MTRACLLATALASVAASVARASEPARMEEVVAVCLVPPAAEPVGEVRLVRRGEEEVVQTLLDTVPMRRVVAEIRAKEERNWPVGAAGSEEARRYVTALQELQQTLWKRAAEAAQGSPPAQHLLIEFRLSRTRASVALGEFSAEGGIGQRRRVEPQAHAELALDRGYIARNMRLILEDACQAAPETLAAWLRQFPNLANSAESGRSGAGPAQDPR